MTDPIPLGLVRERMVDLEDHHEEEINVEGVMARMLRYGGDPDELGRHVHQEVQRAMILLQRVYVTKLGLKPTTPNAVAIGFLQGITFATAYRDVAGGGERWTIKVCPECGMVAPPFMDETYECASGHEPVHLEVREVVPA